MAWISCKDIFMRSNNLSYCFLAVLLFWNYLHENNVGCDRKFFLSRCNIVETILILRSSLSVTEVITKFFNPIIEDLEPFIPVFTCQGLGLPLSLILIITRH